MEPTSPTERFESPTAANAATTELQPLRGGGAGERCENCSSPVAAEQRYCVECGERRGPAQLPLATRAPHPAPAATDPRPAGRLRMSANSTLIAGIGTLLLAIGLGVLIGRSTNQNVARSPAPQVVTIAGAAASPAPAATATAPKTPAAGTAAKASKTAPAAAGKGTPPPAAARPRTGPNRPGYTNNKFTGNFFGP